MDTMTSSDAHGPLAERFAQLDIEAAKADVLPFVKDPASVALWSREFFLSLLPRLTFV